MSERMWELVEAASHWVAAWSVVVGLIGVWLKVARPRRAATRYAGWFLATVAGVALLPVVLGVQPRTSWRALVASIRHDRSTPKVSPGPFRSWFDGLASTLATGPMPVTQKAVDNRAQMVRTPGDAVLTRRVPDLAPARSAEQRWLLVALSIWAAGLGFFGARLASSALRVRALLARLEISSPIALASELESVRRELGIRRPVRVAIHPEIAAPMCLGLFRPVILWPTPQNCPMNPRQQLASLTHELAHLRHGDDWLFLLAELWRTLSWFYPPVHLTLARARRECEYRCDDLAAGKLETPERYASWLLDLAPVRVAPPILVASLTGRVSVADRVRRIVNGELRWAKPLAPRQVALLSVFAILLLSGAASVRLVGFTSQATAAAANADIPLPDITPQELGKKMRAAWARLDFGLLEVEFDETRNVSWNPGHNQGTEGEQNPTLLTFSGRARCARQGILWRTECESMIPNSTTKKLRPDRWSTGFDGEKHFDWQIDNNNGLVVLGETHHAWDQWTPRQIFSRQRDFLLDSLEFYVPETYPYVISQRLVDGVPCYVLTGNKPGGEWGLECAVAPTNGYLCIRSVQTYKGKKYTADSLHDVREVAPGIWAPARVEYDWFDVEAKDASTLIMRRTTRVKTYEPIKHFARGAFAFELPQDIDVTDRRIGYSFHTDPWWPEAAAFLRTRFDWPKPLLEGLNNLGSPSEPRLAGKPAPSIRVASWINSAPRALADLRGKVVLLVFWNGKYYPGPEVVSTLRPFYENYRRAGLEMISIHTPTDETENVTSIVRELHMENPVAIDQKGDKGQGVTAAAYGAADHTCAVLIDHEGIVHSVGHQPFNGGKLVETVVPLLEKAGARDVKPIVTERERLSRRMSQAVDTQFQEQVQAALAANPHGSISGRVTDGRGQPIEAARVKGSLQLTVLTFASPGAYQIFSLDRHPEQWSVDTGPDGRFELPLLCKGTYILDVKAEGKARVERRATIAPDQKPVSIDFILDQGDSIFGMVQDEDGRPVPAATVTPTLRQYVRNQSEWTTSPMLDPIQTDAAGLFRFSGLRTGSYTFEVSASGCEMEKVEQVPAGSACNPIRLKRTKAP